MVRKMKKCWKCKTEDSLEWFEKNNPKRNTVWCSKCYHERYYNYPSESGARIHDGGESK